MLNIILAVFAVILWGGAMGWYFHRDFRNGWHSYRTRWTRLDQD